MGESGLKRVSPVDLPGEIIFSDLSLGRNLVGEGGFNREKVLPGELKP